MAWEAAVKSSGAVMARDMVDLADCIMAFNCLPGYTGQGFGAMAGGGGPGGGSTGCSRPVCF